ncbi:MAG: bifunctional aspartate transaminase/aspartate 4-decarboxylase [Limosilactobacillus sp.]|uniref:bifunctional aspartate transaminase/aspartate 4-decarboxylase n=1 Tax=Limosilactobacillus sp. TaxID=2773925 RepID=UPI0026F83543|nr:bifunctional aspartate transaminase/aspartate 4-decarboxylase [Limosilactobacillus sp.]
MSSDLDIFKRVDGANVGKLDKLSNFEVAAIFNRYAAKNLRGNDVVNGGRGNPNWIATTARLAFARLMELGVEEAERTFSDERGMGGYIESDGLYDRLMSKLGDSRADVFLREAIETAIEKIHVAHKDLFIHELIDGAVGDHYPFPPRCLHYTERILRKYLQKTCFKDVDMGDDVDIFPTEGGTAAMVYIFQELNYAHVLYPGDTVVINSSIFTPYLQIPELREYNLNIETVETKRENDWQMTDEQFEKLKDPKVKAFFAVNPTNPTARAFTPDKLEKFKEVIEANPDLVIITDDVYGTFSTNYKSIFAVAPHNTILVYSFSKLYGATGQRLGVVAMHSENVCDRIIHENSMNRRLKELDERRYSIVVPEPEKMKFIDRMVADSRAIGLYHTAGLSSPQQIMMDMFALSNIKDDGENDYVKLSRQIVDDRYHEFWNSLGIKPDESPENTRYYTLVDIYDLMKQRRGEDFSEYFRNHYNYLDFTYRLAMEFGAVLMDAKAFGAEEGNVRVSLANLEKDEYRKLAEAIVDLVEEYYQDYKQSK